MGNLSVVEKTAFVLMPFADDFFDVYKYFISECIQRAGYVVKRADDIKSQNNIIGDIVDGIVNSDLIVADLTGANPNVYYELGIAHGLNKKVILLTQEINEIPFDLRSYRVVGYRTHFAKMEQAKKELHELAIDAFNGNLPFGNPVKDFGKINCTLLETVSVMKDEYSESSGEDLGLFDYRIMLEDGLGELTKILTEVGLKLTNEVVPEITKTTEQISSNSFTTKEQLTIMIGLASHIQEYGAFLKPKNEHYRLLLKNIETSFENLLSGSNILSREDAEQLKTFLDTISGLESSAVDARQGMASLIETMESLQKIEANFNRAKSFMVTELKTFVDNIDQTISVVARAGRLGNSLVKNCKAS